MIRLLSVTYLFLLMCGVACAQEPELDKSDAVAVAPPASPAGPVEPDKHIFGVLPNFRTAPDGGEFHRITWRQKFGIAGHDSFDPPGYVIAALYTGIYHLENTNPEFGQGFKGYLHRYGTTYGDQMVGNIMTEGVMPTLLHEDPRYFRRKQGSIPVRVAYAVSRILVTRTDANTRRFNFSEFIGNGITAGIGSAYYPAQRSLGGTARRLGAQLTSDAISNCLKEFWPDIKRWFQHSRL